MNNFYDCPYCGKEYTEPEDLARCILNCAEKKKQEEKRLQEAKLSAEKEKRKKEVDEAIANCKALTKAYMRDYGIYSFTSTDDDSFFSSKFWNLIL